MFAKPKRTSDKKLLESIREQPCFFCHKSPPNDAHHMTTRGSGGGDTTNNLLPLCRRCHTMIHQEGLSKVAWKYPRLKEWMVKHQRFDLLGKL